MNNKKSCIFKTCFCTENWKLARQVLSESQADLQSNENNRAKKDSVPVFQSNSDEGKEPSADHENIIHNSSISDDNDSLPDLETFDIDENEEVPDLATDTSSETETSSEDDISLF